MCHPAGNNDQTAPTSSVVKYVFPERQVEGRRFPKLTLFWHDGGNKPPRPHDIPADEPYSEEENGTLFVGTKGYISCGTYGGNPLLHPQARYADYKQPEPWLERIPGDNPHLEWIRACKGGKPAGSNFEYSGPFTEVVSVGNVAIKSGSPIIYDAANMRIVNNPDADALLYRNPREGWAY